MSNPQPTPPLAPSPSSRSIFSQRSRRQLGLFFAGAGFLALSTAITRRALWRRYRASIPKFYQPSNRPAFEVNGAMEAFEALNLATINVFSVGIMAAGGAAWAFDVADVEDLRRAARRQLGVEGARSDKEVEDEIEEWFATVLGRKDEKEAEKKSKEPESIAALLARLAEKVERTEMEEKEKRIQEISKEEKKS